MEGNICSKCFSSIFIGGMLPDYIKCSTEVGDCKICKDLNRGYFYAREDELKAATGKNVKLH